MWGVPWGAMAVPWGALLQEFVDLYNTTADTAHAFMKNVGFPEANICSLCKNHIDSFDGLETVFSKYMGQKVPETELLEAEEAHSAGLIYSKAEIKAMLLEKGLAEDLPPSPPISPSPQVCWGFVGVCGGCGGMWGVCGGWG